MITAIGYFTIAICSFWGAVEILGLIIQRVASHKELYRAYWEYLKREKEAKNDE